MNVLVISRGYPSDKYPMNGIFEFDQAKAISNLGHKVIFASVDVRSIRRKRKWGFEKFQKEGVLTYGINLPIGRVPKPLLSFFKTIGLKILYKKIEREQGKPDVMHAHFTGTGYSATKLKEKINVPLVITEHSSAMIKPKIDDKLRKQASKTYPKSDKLIVVSPALSQVIKANFGIDSVYIPNIVDTNIFSYGEKDPSEEFIFITVGNLIYRKRMDLTVEAFGKAFSDKDNVKLIVIGEGEEREKIEKIIERDKLANKVVLKGRLDRNAISKYMEKSDCFVLASRAETFGVVYIEAMAVGLPVIATRCGGPEGFVNGSNGKIVPVDDLEELSKAMKEMYCNSDKYCRKHISEETNNLFSPNKVAERIVQVYKDVIK